MSQNGRKTKGAVSSLMMIPALGLLLYLPMLSDDIRFIDNLAREDGIIENTGALFFLLASVLFAMSYAKSRVGNNFFFFGTKKNIFFLFLAFVLFFGFGEEISWGQRIVGIESPEYFAENNMQGEINLHNLRPFHRFADLEQREEKSFWALMFDMGRLYSFFWFGFCILIPLVSLSRGRLSALIRNVNVPIVPLWIGLFFLVNYALSNLLHANVTWEKHNSLMEIKECISAFLFLIVSSYFWFNRQAN